MIGNYDVESKLIEIKIQKREKKKKKLEAKAEEIKTT